MASAAEPTAAATGRRPRHRPMSTRRRPAAPGLASARMAARRRARPDGAVRPDRAGRRLVRALARSRLGRVVGHRAAHRSAAARAAR